MEEGVTHVLTAVRNGSVKLTPSLIYEYLFPQEEDQDSIRKELENLSRCRHANIIAFLGWGLPAKLLPGLGSGVLLFCEWCDGGNLRSAIPETDEGLSQAQMLGVARAVANGMVYLHHRCVDVITRTSHYERFTVCGTGCNVYTDGLPAPQ